MRWPLFVTLRVDCNKCRRETTFVVSARSTPIGYDVQELNRRADDVGWVLDMRGPEDTFDVCLSCASEEKSDG